MMIKNFWKQGFYIPLIVSIILLPCFLAYFLKLEYQKEKKTIELEQRDDKFLAFFSHIDSFSNDPTNLNGGLVRFEKDSSGSTVLLNLKLSKHEESHLNDDLKLLKDNTISEIHNHTTLALKGDSSEYRQLPDTLVTISAITSGDSVGNLKNDNFRLFNRIDSLGSKKSIDIFKLERKNGQGPLYSVSTDEIKVNQILKGILPQIILSLILFFSVCTAFFLIARNLRKERQLSILRTDFMSNMSHELKTPVSTIGVALEALSNFDAGNNPELRKEYINISKLEVERLGLLVDKALNISLYEQGKFIYNKQNVNIDLEIKKILKTLAVQLDKQKAEIFYQSKGNSFLINVDKTHFVNVIYNLIENGIKYAKENAKIDIKVNENVDNIEISVADNGRGIPLEYQKKVFDKFFRVPQGNTHNVKGHGLGLSYVKEIVEGQGGNIQLKSEAGQGSTFIIRMPKVNQS